MIQDKWLGKNLNERKEYIKRIVGSANSQKRRVEIGKNEYRDCEVHSLDVHLPISRLSNIRTKSSQMNWLANNQEMSSDFFTKDPECRNALSVQQDLLFNIANSGGDKNFYELFKNTNTHFREDEPIIINSQGVMINGNTRMSAIRKLLDENEIDYPHLLKIPMAILPPDVTEKDECFLELNYQVRPNIQKQYPWVSEALDCREKLTNGIPLEQIIESYNRDANKKIRSNNVGHPQNLINQLAAGDIFLDSIGCPGMYSKIDGTPDNNGDTINTQFAMWEWANLRSDHDTDPGEQKFVDSLMIQYLKQRLKGDNDWEGGNLYKLIKRFRTDWKLNRENIIEALNREKVLVVEDTELESLYEADVTDDQNEDLEVVTEDEVDYKEEDSGLEEKFNNNPYDDLIIEGSESERIEKPKLKEGIEAKKIVNILLSCDSNIREKKNREKNKSHIYRGIMDIKSKLSEYKLSLEEEEREFSDLNLAEEELTNISSLLDEIKTLMNDRNEG